MNVTEAHLELKKGSALDEQLALEQIDDVTESIEDAFIAILEAEKKQQELGGNSSLNFIVAKSFPDAVNERITGDIPKVIGSFVLMFVYVGVALGKPNCVDNKTLLSMAGLVAILMALITSYGLCSLMGFFIRYLKKDLLLTTQLLIYFFYFPVLWPISSLFCFWVWAWMTCLS